MALSNFNELQKEMEQLIGNYCLMTNTFSIASLSSLIHVRMMMRLIEQLHHIATVPPLHFLCKFLG